jgi:Cu/Ag efflux pump CusA
MSVAALIVVALLFGGMVLYSFGFAAFVFKALPAETAGALIRRAFPHFYIFVIAVSGLAALLLVPVDGVSATLMALVALSTIPTRQNLMPAINNARDTGAMRRFAWLHGGSVAITLAHILAAGYVLARFI